MKNKGQITLLVLVGIVLVIAVSSVFYFTSENKCFDDFDKTLLSSEGAVTTKSLETYTQRCLEFAFNDTPVDVLESNFYLNNDAMMRSGIPYFYFTGTSTLQTKDDVQKFYAEAYRSEVLTCLNGFEIFEKYLESDLIYDESKVELNTFIDEDTITIKINTNAKLIDLSGTAQNQELVSYSFYSNIGSIYRSIDLLLNPLEYNLFFYEPAMDYIESRGFSYIISTERDGDLIFYLNELENEKLDYAFSFHGLFSLVS